MACCQSDELLKTEKEGDKSKEYKEKSKVGYPPGDLLRDLTIRAEQMGFGTKDKEWPKKLNQFARELRPLTPDIRHGYGIDIHIFRDTKGEHTTKNSTWIQISEVKNRSKKDDNSNNGGSSNGSGGGGGGEESSSEKTKDLGKVSPPSPPPLPTQNPRSKTDEIGGDGGGDTPKHLHLHLHQKTLQLSVKLLVVEVVSLKLSYFLQKILVQTQSLH